MDLNNKTKAVFITNYRYVSSKTKSGGVKLCTQDFIKVLETKYDLEIVVVDFTSSFFKKLKFKLGIDVYDYYDAENYKDVLENLIIKKGIDKVFINHTSSMEFAKVCKTISSNCSVVLLSHGNESGDYMHELVQSSKNNLLSSYYKLGKQLVLEAKYRKEYIDKVVVVSEVEKNLEYWLHSNKVVYLPRIYEPDFLEWDPIEGRIGFLADFTHLPNLYGVEKLCEELNKREIPSNLKIILVGQGDERINSVVAKYTFIERLGYLDEQDLKKELGSWIFYLNIVLYYSKGVSTKLAKGMNLGLPIITTNQGNRGYLLEKLDTITAKNVEEFTDILLRVCNNKDVASEIRDIVIYNVEKNSEYSRFSTNL
ncbi:glycosyltransferase [Winogradskyella wichelsiae]|uniref:glycosyltransferase n=1 Tax=Winogradskyella wichelsiae TaxID=2697007 RepID=UPI0015CBA94A|nr:glycosyltransferase family 4 protein [Winogradskyella wichelsiae]